MTEQVEEQAVDLEGIPAVHHEIVRTFGRDVYNLAMCAGLAQEGLGRLDALAQKHRSKHAAIAVQIVQAQMNKLCLAVMMLQGIEAAQVQACQRELLATEVDTPRVQLLH